MMLDIYQMILRCCWIAAVPYIVAFIAGFWLPIQIKFDKRDCWIGIFWNRQEWHYGPAYYQIFICVVPMLPIVITIKRPKFEWHWWGHSVVDIADLNMEPKQRELLGLPPIIERNEWGSGWPSHTSRDHFNREHNQEPKPTIDLEG